MSQSHGHHHYLRSDSVFVWTVGRCLTRTSSRPVPARRPCSAARAPASRPAAPRRRPEPAPAPAPAPARRRTGDARGRLGDSPTIGRRLISLEGNIRFGIAEKISELWNLYETLPYESPRKFPVAYFWCLDCVLILFCIVCCYFPSSVDLP